MSKEVRITLTEAQKAKIKAATGKTMGEIRVSKLGKNLAVSPAAGLSAKDMSIGSQRGDVRARRCDSGDRHWPSIDTYRFADDGCVAVEVRSP